MAKKKYVGLATLTRLVENIKTNFASKSHKHTKSDITDFPTIPTKTSELKNDSGFKTTDNNTTYDLAASVSSANGDVKLNLTAGGTGSGTDAVSIVGTGSTKVTTNVSGVVSIDNPVDSALSSTSTNPVQNKVVKTAIDGKVNNTVTVNGQALTKNVTLKASDVGADASGAASSAVSSHNTSSTSHSDIRQLIAGLTDRLNALADSDDTTLDQMSEIVAYIKNNKSLIEGITTDKVNVSDIVDDLTTNSSNKPLSAAQGMAIKGLIDALQSAVDSKATSAQGSKADTAVQSVKIGSTEYKKGTTVTLPAYPTTLPASDVSAWAKAKTKPSYTASEVGAATADHTHTTVNGHTVEADVPSGAKFTDTWRGVQNNLTSSSATDSLAAAQGKALKDMIDGKAPSSHTHDDRYYTETEMNAKLSAKSDTTHTHNLSTMINTLSEGTATPSDGDYYISQYVGGGTTTTTYYRRPMSALLAYIKSKLATVATSGSYNDLTNKPTIPTVGNGTVTITQNGTSKGTFTMNQSGNTTIELTDNNTNTWRPVVDNLTSTATDSSLSANQGKVLKDLVDGKASSTHTHTKADVGLGNVDNTADADKSVKYATSAGDASTVSGHTVSVNVPANAKFTDTDTHYASKNVVGASTATSNTTSALTNGNVYINSVENGKVTSAHKISGTGTTTVTTDASGNILVNSTAHPTALKNPNALTVSLNGNSQGAYDGSAAKSINVTAGSVGAYTKSEVDTALSKKAASSHKHTADDITSVNASAISGVIDASHLPSYVDDVIEGYLSSGKFYKVKNSDGTYAIEITGETGKIYTDLNTNKIYRWSGSTYAVISDTIALGETSTTAYRGDRGKVAYDHSQVTSGNPHKVTKSDVGLGNVENKSSATIRGELTKANVTTALGYTPPTTNTTYSTGTASTAGLTKLYTGTGTNADGTMTQAAIKSALDGKANSSHTHNYAGSASAGGSATSAVKLDTTTAGSATQPVYFTGGKPAACTYTLGKSVPSDAKFTDTNTWRPVETTLTSENLNDVKVAGYYNAGGGNTVTNKPNSVDHFGLIVIHRANGGYYTQIIYNDTTSWRRFCVNGVWGSWIEEKITDTTYIDATQSTHGLLSTTDKKKLDGIATGANAYTHPTSSGNKHIPSGGSSGQILRWASDGTAAWGADNNTTYSSKAAVSGGTDVSLVTTGEKYNWNVAKTHASATHAPSNAERNVIVGVKQNGVNLAVSSDRKVDISVPTLDTSDTTGTFSVPDYSSRVVSCENQLKSVDSSLLQVNTNLSQLNNDMDTAQNDIETMSTDVSDAKAKVNLYEEKVLALQSQVVSLQNENTELKNTVTELNGKITDKMYRTKVLLKYYNTNWMYATINVGKQFAGSVPIASMIYISGTATINTTNISVEQVKDDGNVTIWAYGSGYVSAHLLYVMIDCRSD